MRYRALSPRETAVTDEKIDEIVYELYWITDEERKIQVDDFRRGFR